MGGGAGPPLAAVSCQKREAMRGGEELPGAAVSCQRMAEKGGGRAAPIHISRSVTNSWSKLPKPQKLRRL
jgi:hypothetical protein